MYDENVRKVSWVSFWRVIRALQSNIVICYFPQPAPPYLKRKICQHTPQLVFTFDGYQKNAEFYADFKIVDAGLNK
jgi:hypothetical protein